MTTSERLPTAAEHYNIPAYYRTINREIRRDGLLVHRSEWASADQLAAVIANLAQADRRLAAGEQPRMSLNETLWSMERLTKKP